MRMQTENYFGHESSYIDEPCSIGEGNRIWHFSHIMKNSTIGNNCNIGQYVVISPGCTIGNNESAVCKCGAEYRKQGFAISELRRSV